ncbi:MAG: DUF4145 domain-containing protein [Acidobacteriaceae bacterium]
MVSIHINPEYRQIGWNKATNSSVVAGFYTCPACTKYIVWLIDPAPILQSEQLKAYLSANQQLWKMVYPRGVSRSPLSPDVTGSIAEDYKEACLVFEDSPKASAALSRRCLQTLLLEKAGVKTKDLSKGIDEVLASKTLPTHLAESIDAVRNIGNFAAHPIKSTSSGEIVDVEPGEAEWMLDALENLIDFYIVQPSNTQRKRDALNKKLQDISKPPMK